MFRIQDNKGYSFTNLCRHDLLSLKYGYEYCELGTLKIELAKCSLRSYTLNCLTCYLPKLYLAEVSVNTVT